MCALTRNYRGPVYTGREAYDHERHQYADSKLVHCYPHEEADRTIEAVADLELV